MNNEEFVKEQMKLSKEDIIANYWYTYQDNVERLGIEHQLNLKDKEIERLNNIINKAIEYIKINGNWWTDEIEGCQDLIKILKGEDNEKIKCEKPIEIAPFKVDTSINVGETTYVGIGSDKE